MKYAVWYMKPRWFREGMIGRPPFEEINHTHVKLRELEARDLDEVYYQSQGEVWSPNGEARPLIEEKGLQHTSMSVGDVIQQGDDFWVVASFGFTKLEGIVT